LIVVTRGIGDASTGYLAGVRDAVGIRVEILVRPALKGFRAACRDGLRVAKGELVAVVPNTTVVTDGWLDQLAALLNADPAIAVVGPTTNATRPPQGLTEVPYHDAEGLRAFAASWRMGRRGSWFTAESLSNACLVGRRQALDAIGGGRAARVMGTKSRHFAARVRRAGYSLAVARDLFVHSGPLLSERAGDTPSGDSPPKAVGPRARVTLTMIVRNEEGNLPSCLESVRGLFDEIVVVDTGSTDRTVEIARSFGARVFDFIWVDDFAAARNAALARATGDYAFWLDADDVVEPAERAKLVALLTGLRAGDDAAYVVRCACDPDTGGGGGSTVVDHVRLFPLREGVRWTYRVHEQILPALRRVGVSVRWSDVVVRHTGYANPAIRRRKLVRDVRILDAELAERPGDPFVLFNLGSIAIEREDWRPALEHLRASLRNSAPEDSITRKLYALISRAHQMLGETELALAACGAGLQHDPDDAELLFRRAVIHRNTGNRTEAEACWRRILSLRRPERFSSVDQGIYGHLTRRNLAALSEEAGDRDGARRYWSEVQVECPGDAEARASLRRLAGTRDDAVTRSAEANGEPQ
jgi:GT2 family glycosyltransferase